MGAVMQKYSLSVVVAVISAILGFTVPAAFSAGSYIHRISALEDKLESSTRDTREILDRLAAIEKYLEVLSKEVKNGR